MSLVRACDSKALLGGLFIPAFAASQLSASTHSTMTVLVHNGCLSPLSKDHGAQVVASALVDAIRPPTGVESSLALDLERHRRWNTTLSRGFLDSIARVEINETHARDGVDYYTIEVFLTLPRSRLPKSQCNEPACDDDNSVCAAHPTFKVERRYSDFEQLREHVLAAVSQVPVCLCSYCVEFVTYIRFKSSQPRSLVKLMAGTEKRKTILSKFVNDFVKMGRQCVSKTSGRNCESQRVVPALLEAFLLDHAEH